MIVNISEKARRRKKLDIFRYARNKHGGTKIFGSPRGWIWSDGRLLTQHQKDYIFGWNRQEPHVIYCRG